MCGINKITEDKTMDEKIRKIRMGPAKCAVDLGDGSERGEYVNQDYILHTLGRPHRSINLMYCYYPLDKEWPGRISEVMKNADVSFQWDYPYDDYFPYKGGLNGNTDDEPFTCMRDIRRHGQDITLTLTIDPNVSDDHLIAIAKDLRPFGRLLLRINHEATGNWFSFTKRATYQQVADFYIHFHNILKEYAPNVSTILCAGACSADSEEVERVLEAIAAAGFECEPQDGVEQPSEDESEAVDTAPQNESVGLTVEIPLDKVAVGNLTKLLDAKGNLIRKALGITDLRIEVLEDRVAFPWFSQVDADSAAAYTHFISALCEMSRNAKRVTATEKPVDNEKYAFRCFLLRLGFIGSEYKAERKILLKNLSGSSAFKNGGAGHAVSE